MARKSVPCTLPPPAPQSVRHSRCLWWQELCCSQQHSYWHYGLHLPGRLHWWGVPQDVGGVWVGEQGEGPLGRSLWEAVVGKWPDHKNVLIIAMSTTRQLLEWSAIYVVCTCVEYTFTNELQFYFVECFHSPLLQHAASCCVCYTYVCTSCVCVCV